MAGDTSFSEIMAKLDLRLEYLNNKQGAELHAWGIGSLGYVDEQGFMWSEAIDSKIEKLATELGMANIAVEDLVREVFSTLEEDFKIEMETSGNARKFH